MLIDAEKRLSPTQRMGSYGKISRYSGGEKWSMLNQTATFDPQNAENRSGAFVNRACVWI